MLTLLAAILFYAIFMWTVQKRRQVQVQAVPVARRRLNRQM